MGPARFCECWSTRRTRLDMAWRTRAGVYFTNSPAFDIIRGDVVARYPKTNPLLSGWLLGAEKLYGRAGIGVVPVGSGRIVLLGFRTQHRGQPHGTFKFLFNSLLLSAAAPANLTRVMSPSN